VAKLASHTGSQGTHNHCLLGKGLLEIDNIIPQEKKTKSKTQRAAERAGKKCFTRRPALEGREKAENRERREIETEVRELRDREQRGREEGGEHGRGRRERETIRQKRERAEIREQRAWER
jgi:hypothetical protein